MIKLISRGQFCFEKDEMLLFIGFQLIVSFVFTASFGRPPENLEKLDPCGAAFKKRTQKLFQISLDLLEEKENNGMGVLELHARVCRRIVSNPKSRHYNPEHSQLLSRIINKEDIFKAPVLLPIDGVVLKTICIIGIWQHGLSIFHMRDENCNCFLSFLNPISVFQFEFQLF